MMRRPRPTALRPVRRSTRRLAIEPLEARETPANFTPGNIVIYRVGDGLSGLVNVGAAVFLDEYTPTGTLVQTIALPTTASGNNKQLIASGVATSEGLMTRSANGGYLVVTGYARDLGGSGSVAGTASATVPRVVGLIGADGSVDTSTALTDFADANNPRGAVTTNGTDIWVGGAAGGVRYATKGSTTSNQLSTTILNIRQTGIFDGQLYIGTASGSAIRIGAVGTGLPTTSGQTITNLPGFVTSGSPYGFFLADLNPSVAGVDTLYYCDDTNTTGVGGVTKYSLVNGSWVSNGVVGSSSDAYRGLTATVSGTTITLYATRKGGSTAAGGGELVSLVDSSGYNGTLTGTPTLLATATANTSFRGVAFAPVFNAPPVNTFHDHTTNEDVGISLTGTTVADPDAGTANIKVTFSVPSGKLHVIDNVSGGVTPAQITGNDTTSVTITAPLAAVNTTLINGVFGGVAFFPATDFNGVVPVTMTTNDLGNTGFGGPQIDTDTFNVTVFSVNDAPVNFVPAAQTTNEDTPLVFSSANGNAISVADVDAGTGQVKVTLTATHGTLTLGGTGGLTVTGNGTGVITATGTLTNVNAGLAGLTFSPALNYNGPASLEVKSDDQGNTGSGGALTDTDTVAITVNPVNDAPVLNDASFLVNQGVPNGTVLGTVTATDVENDTITYTITAGNTGNAFAIDPATGQITVAASAAVVGGPFHLTVTATDNGTPNQSGTATVTVTVNAPPVVANRLNDTAIFEDTPLTIDLAPVFADAEDPVSALKYLVTVNTGPAIVATNISGTLLTLTPAPDSNGSTWFSIRATDTGGLFVESVFQLIVTPVNDAPTLDAIPALTVPQDAGETTVNLSGILPGPADESGQTLTIAAVSANPGLIPNPSVQYSGGATGTLKFTPVAGTSGSATITVTVTDNGGTNNGGLNAVVRTFTVVVNSRPTTSGIPNRTVLEDAAAQTIDLGASFADVEDPDPALTYTVVANSNAGLFASVSTTGTNLHFTPKPNEFGTSALRVRATDTAGLFVESEFDVTVTPVNDAPTIDPIGPLVIDEDSGEQVIPLTGISAGQANESGQALTVTVSSGNSILIPNPIVEYTGGTTGTLRFTLPPDANGFATITVTVTDNGGTANGGVNALATMFPVTVNGQPDRPVIDTAPTPMLPAVPLKTDPAGATIGQLLTHVTDPDAGALQGFAVTGLDNTNGTWQFKLKATDLWAPIPAVSPTNALLLAADLDTRVRFLPKPRFTGFASLSFKAWDQTNGAAEGTFDDATDVTDISYSTATERTWVAVGKTTPKLDAEGHPLLTPVREDARASAAFPVKKFLGLLAREVGAATPLGVAVSAADEAGGRWQFNIGKGWQNVGTVNDGAALLLRPTDRLRFLPSHDFDGQATVGYHTWDLTGGTFGTKVPVTGTPFSSATETAIVDVIPVNDRPILDLSKAAVLNPVNAGQTTNEAPFSTLFAATDVEGAPIGIAITKAAGPGVWEYLPAGGNWTTLPAVSAGRALFVEPGAAVRFTAAATATDATAALSFKAWDQTTGVAGQQGPIRGTAFSKATEVLTVAVENSAPGLSPTATPTFTTVKSGGKPGLGDAVSKLLGPRGSSISDSDPKALRGIAITFADNANGTWQYSLGGGKWVDVGTLSNDSALLLTDVNRLRFVPTAGAGFVGTATLQFKAWDRTTGQAGDRIDTTGALNSFSQDFETATVTVVA